MGRRQAPPAVHCAQLNNTLDDAMAGTIPWLRGSPDTLLKGYKPAEEGGENAKKVRE